MRKWVGRIFWIALLLLLAWWAKERFLVSEETRIQRQIAAMEQAVEQNKILRLADAVAGDYGDDHGLDKGTLLAAVRAFRAQQDALLIHISDLTIQVQPGTNLAQVTLIARVVTKPKGGGETELNADRFRLYLRKDDQVWRLTRVESPELKFD